MRMGNVTQSLIAFSGLLVKAASYHFNVCPLTLRDQNCLVDVSLA